MNNEKSCASTNINWYPGHMAKTKREIIEDLKLIDIVIEILDARIPLSSRNPDIKEITNGKRKIILLNKCDLADEKINNKWVKELEKEAPVILTDSNSGKGIEKVEKQINLLMKDVIEKQKLRGRLNKTIRIMILGIPNVGKSSFINRICKKNSANVGNKPGITKRKQWIRIGKNQELLDTAGVLWPKFENSEIALNLAFTGTIKDEILDKVDIAYELLKKLFNNYSDNILYRYNISQDELNKIKNNENMYYDLMKLIGQKRGAIVKGGQTDDEKVSNIIIDDFRNCKIGKISLEEP